MIRLRGVPAPSSRAELQGFAGCVALMLEGYLFLVLAEPMNRVFLAVLFAAGAWRMLRIWTGDGGLVDWSRTSQRVAASSAFLGLGFVSVWTFTGEMVHFLAAVVVWVEALILVSRWRGPGILRALTYLSLLHVVLAAFVVRPAATVPLLLIYLFLVVRTLGVADRRVGEVAEQGRFLAVDLGTFAAVSTLAFTLFLILPRPGPALVLSTSPGNTPAENAPAPSNIVYAPPDPGSGRGNTGFSSEMDLNEISDLIPDRRIVMRVGRLDPEPPGPVRQRPELRLRGIAFLQYEQGSWHRSPATRDVDDSDDGARDGFITMAADAFEPKPAATGWQVELEELGNNTVFLPPGARAIECRGYLLTDGEENWFFPLAPRESVKYQVRGVELDPAQLGGARVRSVPADSPYLAIAHAEAHFRLLAEEKTEGVSGDLARIVAIRDMLLGEFKYSLHVPLPPEGEDPVEWFLWDGKVGYCVHFATSMALLLRSLGIPCRVAGGYITPEWDEVRRQYVVRQSHAHAWVEVPFEGLGWVPFEPTPLPNRLESLGDLTPVAGGPSKSNLGAFLTDFERFDRSRFLRDVGDEIAGTLEVAVGGSGAGRAGLAWLGLGLGAFLLYRTSSWLRKRAVVRREGGPSGSRSAAVPPAVPFYRDFVRLAARKGMVRNGFETPAEFAGRVDRHGGAGFAATVVRIYYSIVFGRRPLTSNENSEARSALGGLERSLTHTGAEKANFSGNRPGA